MRKRSSRRGFALLVAIWVLALLLILVAGFAVTVHSEAQISRNAAEVMQARWAARAGIYRAQIAVEQAVAAPPLSLGGGATLTVTSDDEELSLGEATFTTVIADEAGKLNINTVPVTVLGRLFSAEVADAIVDWRDANDTPMPQGAEEEYYAALPAPYQCKNAPFDSVDELLLVKGVTAETLETKVGDSELTVRDLVTVCSYDVNTDATGMARLNVRTASRQQWRAAFGTVLDEAEIDAIMFYRTRQPLNTPADLLRVEGVSRDKVAKIYDRLTGGTAGERVGLVNVNTAPAEVLAALPAMDDATAQAIVAYRADHGPFADVGAVLAVAQISDEQFIACGNMLTTRSTLFCITATGTMPSGIEHVITGVVKVNTPEAKATSQLVYWRE